MEELRIHEDEDQTINVFLQPNTRVYQRRKQELINAAGMTEDEAEDYLLTTPIQLELYYDFDRGLFGVEAEALECCEIYNPYTGVEIPNDNLLWKQN